MVYYAWSLGNMWRFCVTLRDKYYLLSAEK